MIKSARLGTFFWVLISLPLPKPILRMRDNILCFVLIIFTFACSTTPEGYTIEGQLRGEVENGTKVFLKTTDSLRQKLIEVDTTVVENGSFSFTGNTDSPKLYYLFMENIRGSAPVVVENGSIQFKAHKDSLGFSTLKGTLQNDLFMNYLEETRRFVSMSRSMNDDLRIANVQRDTVAMASLRDEYMELQEKAKTFEIDFMKEHPEGLISALILDKAIMSKTMTVDEMMTIFESFTPEIKASSVGKRIQSQLEKAKSTAIGSKAPEFSGPTPNGNELALNEIKGKVTLIDFWAAWCKPCRMENPNIVSVYNKYKDKGLNVVGVSLDRKKEDWLGAIESDGLEWNHVSNLQYFNGPIAQLYSVNAIPAAFLLDENGVIIAKNLRGPALEAKVSELLN